MSKYKTTWHDIAKAILRKEEFITEEQLIEQDKQDIQEFSRSQLDALARQYSDLKGKTISIDNANKLRKIFDKIPNHFLNDLRKKHIPFLSGLALSRMVQKGIPVREDTDYLKSKLNTHQINNIKNTWKSKKASDVTPAVKAMIKKMDIPTQLAIKAADIPHISKLVEDMAVRIKNIKMPPNTGGEVPNSIIVNVPAGKDPKEVGRGILKRMTGKVPTSFDVVKEDASDMVQAKAAGTQKRIADLTTNINDKEEVNEGYEGTILAYLKKYADKAYFSYRKLMVKKGSEGVVKTVLTRGVNDRSSLIYSYDLPPIVGVNEGTEDDKAYAIGMSKAKEIKKDSGTPLKKSTIEKGHEIAKAIKKNEAAEMMVERVINRIHQG